ncbi:hypothetical protein DSM112329_01782 [Paraconexibacter sp. AEG42_29]|uniref:Guanylate cyclase domain-containing protein n=1 Tax=Paraconexibacter sp. AEG42_29 TaxID=2997339 RepID=A0AAU7AUC4_9ACTN
MDARFDLRGDRTAPASVAVVGIDAATLAGLGTFPFRRAFHARLVRRLTAMGVRSVAYDVQFTEASDRPADDDALVAAFADAPAAVLSTTEVDADGRTGVLGGTSGEVDVLREIGARAGNTVLDSDPDGAVRKLARQVDGLASFPVAVVEAATGRPVDRTVFDDDGEAYIDFPGPAGTIREVSFVDVLDGRVPAAALRGRIVVVGATAPSLGDTHTTSVSRRDDAMSGPELQAAAVVTLLGGAALRPAPGAVGVLLTLLLAGAGPLAALRLGPLRALLAAGAAGSAAAGGVYLAFRSGHVVPATAPALGLALGTLAGIAVAAVYTALERERTRTLFTRFVAESVVDDVLARSGDEGRLGGVQVDATVLFCDLRGSTALLELAPEAGIEILNRFLSAMADAVLAHGGTLVGFRGDGLMALFGPPLDLPDHAERALAAAEEMAGARLTATNAWLAARDDGLALAPLRLGVGLDSGAVMAGTVGSQARMEYTAIGDAANVAARVEALTKTEDRAVLLTGRTRERLGTTSSARLEALGERPIRGRSAPVQLFAPGPATPGQPAQR